MLDIHATPSSDTEQNHPSLEILEAGTGHGALTLHLARAIHAANACIPNSKISQDARALRQAIIHSVDVSSQYSEHAAKLLRGFRQGLYSNDVDFHVNAVSRWIDEQIIHRRLEEEEDKSFLSHAILDMPESYHHIKEVVSALRQNGNLILFNPSITQIMAAVRTIREKRLPVYLQRVLETGPTMTGGKEWDIRAVKSRSRLRTEHLQRIANPSQETLPEETASDIQDLQNDGTMQANTRDNEAPAEAEQGFEMICRPKVFARVVGGGFLGLWRKLPANGKKPEPDV